MVERDVRRPRSRCSSILDIFHSNQSFSVSTDSNEGFLKTRERRSNTITAVNFIGTEVTVDLDRRTESCENDYYSKISANITISNEGVYSYSFVDNVGPFKTDLSERVSEVYETEKTYVRTLYVLLYVLPRKVKRKCQHRPSLLSKFETTYQPICSALKGLYRFHNDIILPYMKQCQEESQNERIWFVIERHLHNIEDLYKAYYIAYNENQSKIEELCLTNSLLYTAMIQCQLRLRNIYPIDELNCANQRLLRYIILMRSYMKDLNTKSNEFNQINSIYKELVNIAQRCEEELIVSLGQLEKLKARFSTKLKYFDDQQLLWHGRLKKQSPRQHRSIFQRYLILLSDCVLVCHESGNKLELKTKLSMKNLIVYSVDNEQIVSKQFYSKTYKFRYYFRFHLNAIEKCYEFLTNQESERTIWVNKIQQAIEDFRQRDQTIEVRGLCPCRSELQLGDRAPIWTVDLDVSRCQICHNRFRSKLKRRRHHCRSCGRCICGACSSENLILKYCNKDGPVRICDLCYEHFTGIKKSSLLIKRKIRDPEKTILFGNVLCLSTNSTVWIDLQEDCRLYIYDAKLDKVESDTIDLLELIHITCDEDDNMLILNTKEKIYRFSIPFDHTIKYQGNEYISQQISKFSDKIAFYTKLWYDAIELAKSEQLPTWYQKKRESADSGISISAL